MDSMTRRRFLGTAGIAAVAPALGTITGHAQTADAAVAVEKNVVFGKGGEIELRCDIYRPPAGVSAKRMATIHVHGGGFTGGSKETLSERILPFARRGYVAIAAQYRLAGQAKWPLPVEDVKAAIRWTRANASTLGIDPNRIALVGYSAGGLLALTAAGTQDRMQFEGRSGTPGVPTAIAACCAFYPVTDTPTALMPAGVDAATQRDSVPATHISKLFAPTMLLHGVADTTVPIESSQRFFELLRKAGVTTELHTFAGAPHVFDQAPDFAAAAAQMFDLFLDRYVINPRPFPVPARGGGPGRGGA